MFPAALCQALHHATHEKPHVALVEEILVVVKAALCDFRCRKTTRALHVLASQPHQPVVLCRRHHLAGMSSI